MFIPVETLAKNFGSCAYSFCGSGAFAPVAPLDEVRRFVAQSMFALGTPESSSVTFADSVLDAEYRGVSRHGIKMFVSYVKDIQNKLCDPKSLPTVAKNMSSAAVVCGHNGLGPVIAHFCMNLAVEKARGNGIGMVVARDSNDYGTGATYSNEAAERGLIGMCFTNGPAVMAPPNARDVALGLNPISMATPGSQDGRLDLDMTTTATTIEGLEYYDGLGLKLPEFFALNRGGQVETSAKVAWKYKKLMPLGATESHKGFGLALMVEVLSGILAGAKCSPNIDPLELGRTKPPGLGHGFIAINPEAFAPNFWTRSETLLRHIRNMPPVDSHSVVRVPGDKERGHAKKVEKEGGLAFPKEIVDSLKKLSSELGVEPIYFIPNKTKSKSLKDKKNK